MSSKSKIPVHSPPLIISPVQAHKSTLIILHGRGSTAEKFAANLLNHPVSSSIEDISDSSDPLADTRKCFQAHFPNTKFVFPTAPLRRAMVFKRSLTHQWFDNWSLTQPELKQHLQIPGLRETSAYLHNLLREEIESIGAEHVVLMGLSQGCAASIIATLLWTGEPFGALLGMCGYLPFRRGMQEYAEDAISKFDVPLVDDEELGGDFFERDNEDCEDSTKLAKAVKWLREELQVDDGNQHGKSSSSASIPIFMSHGKEDDKVPCAFGQLAAAFLRDLDLEVTWKEYDGLGHWYSDDMLRGVVRFLKDRKGWTD